MTVVVDVASDDLFGDVCDNRNMCCILTGSVVTVYGQVTFTSARSLEIEVVVDVEVLFEKETVRQRAIDAFFTYVCINKLGKAMAVPPLQVCCYFLESLARLAIIGL